ncbi:MarR family winged helix-turn-helix transcriptional regulator [Saccharothrix violaceirubra]
MAGAELTYLLGISFQLLVTEFDRRLGELGYTDLRPVHGFVFQLLKNGGLTGTELAEHLGVTKQAAGQTVAYLEDRGYVSREEHPGGGRRRLVVLTDRAREHLRVAGRVMRELESTLPGGEALRVDLAAVVRSLAGTALPPLRPVW